jgi:hypothetical protein
VEQALEADSSLETQANDLVTVLGNRYKMFYRVKHSTRKNRIFYIFCRKMAFTFPSGAVIFKDTKEDYYAETSFAQDYGRP